MHIPRTVHSTLTTNCIHHYLDSISVHAIYVAVQGQPGSFCSPALSVEWLCSGAWKCSTYSRRHKNGDVSIPFQLNRNGYRFRALGNGEWRSIKWKLNRNGTASASAYGTSARTCGTAQFDGAGHGATNSKSIAIASPTPEQPPARQDTELLKWSALRSSLERISNSELQVGAFTDTWTRRNL